MNGDVTVVNFLDRRILCSQELAETGRDLHDLVNEPGRKKIVLNFSNLEYFNIALLGLFIAPQKILHARGDRLVLCNLNEDCLELLRLAMFDRLFHVASDEAAAIEMIHLEFAVANELNDRSWRKHTTTLRLSGSEVTDSSLQILGQFKNLKSLTITSTMVTDAGLKEHA